MKKISLVIGILWLSVFLFIACKKEATESQSDFLLPGAVPCSVTVGYKEACQIAEYAIKMLESQTSTRSEKKIRAIEKGEIRSYVTPATRYGEPGDTLMYVFNFVGNAGFAVVATDRRTDQLLVVTEKGNYTPGKNTGVDGFDLYMAAATNYLEALNNTPNSSDTEYEEGMQQIVTLDNSSSVGPLVPVAWGEGAPYRMLCFTPDGKRAPAGCVATAIAQIMTAHSYPASVQLTYPGADIQTLTFNWPGIKQHVDTYGCGLVCTEHAAIGRMFREIGQLVEMDYGENISCAYSSKTPACLAYFGYTSSNLSAYNYNTMRNSIKNDGPVYMKGATNNDKEHVWVVDGYEHVDITTEIWFVSATTRKLLESHRAQSAYVHCNWGWDGNNNGLFSANVFDTNKVEILDPNSSKIEFYNFTQSLQMITEIRPTNP